MRLRFVWRRPLLTLTQVVVLLFVLAALFVVLDLNRRAKAGRLVGVGKESLQEELSEESTRQVELQATLSYVQSEEYVSIYAREEGGYLLPGEKRIVPLINDAAPVATSAAVSTPDPALFSRPWQAWWQLLTDQPLPGNPQ